METLPTDLFLPVTEVHWIYPYSNTELSTVAKLKLGHVYKRSLFWAHFLASWLQKVVIRQTISSKKFCRGVKNVNFYADFKSVEKVAKKFIQRVTSY
jgi:hypothetical protein